MNIDRDFCKFVIKEITPLILFVGAFLLHFVLPKPWNLIVLLVLFCYSAKELCKITYSMMRFRYELHLKNKEKVWNALKDTK